MGDHTGVRDPGDREDLERAEDTSPVAMASGRRLGSSASAIGRANVDRPYLTGPAFAVLLILLAVLLVGSLFLAVSVGSVRIPLATVWRVVWEHLPWADGLTQPARQDAIIWEFRVPRALLAAVVGGALAVAGATLQAAVRNPLAEPYVLGVVQGASFGAVLTIVVGTAAVGGLWLSVSAFLGAMAALAVLLVLGRRRGKVEPVRLVLAGVAIGELFYAGTSWLQLQLSDGTRSPVFSSGCWARWQRLRGMTWASPRSFSP